LIIFDLLAVSSVAIDFNHRAASLLAKQGTQVWRLASQQFRHQIADQ
jgi:hypothetical protein